MYRDTRAEARAGAPREKLDAARGGRADVSRFRDDGKLAMAPGVGVTACTPPTPNELWKPPANGTDGAPGIGDAPPKPPI